MPTPNPPQLLLSHSAYMSVCRESSETIRYICVRYATTDTAALIAQAKMIVIMLLPHRLLGRAKRDMRGYRPPLLHMQPVLYPLL